MSQVEITKIFPLLSRKEFSISKPLRISSDLTAMKLQRKDGLISLQ